MSIGQREVCCKPLVAKAASDYPRSISSMADDLLATLRQIHEKLSVIEGSLLPSPCEARDNKVGSAGLWNVLEECLSVANGIIGVSDNIASKLGV